MIRVQSFSEITDDTTQLAGGKGGVLAKLYQSGYFVPDGFVILSTAFNYRGLIPDVWEQVEDKFKQLKRDHQIFVVRSSSLSEDSSQASFAGEFETILGVETEEELREAIQTVWESKRSGRVQLYGETQGIGSQHEMAVVVQIQVDPEISGVLLTVDPFSAKPSMIGNFVQGLGDKLVSGEVDAHEFRIERANGTYQGPTELKPYSEQIYRTALRLEKDLGSPQDIEWTIAENKLYTLQSRPITNLINIHDPIKGYYNVSLTSDYLWSNVGVGENLPGVMKPSTWSIWNIIFNDIQEWKVKDIPSVGNIAGRPYYNMSIIVSVPSKIYGKEKALKLLEPAFGKLPDITLPLIPISYLDILGSIPESLRWRSVAKKLVLEIPEFVKTNPEKCKKLIEEIKNSDSLPRLHSLWVDEAKPLFIHSGLMLKTINDRYQGPWLKLANELGNFVGKEEVDLLMSIVGIASGPLQGLGLMSGVYKVAIGEMSKEEYMELYGHRFTHEWHLDAQRPYEDPEWLDEQLRDYYANPVDLYELLDNQQKKHDGAWERFQNIHPKKSKELKSQLDQFVSLSLDRENIRSEITRSVSVIRELYLKVGKLLGVGDDVFFLTYNELEAVSNSEEEAIKYISVRREMDNKLRALPNFPPFISGAFNPFTWARNPGSKVDLFDSHREPVSVKDRNLIVGNPGSGGRVEGRVRVLSHVEEGYLLQKGEILVTSTTNIGWTPLFPRALAVITDIGMPLAHAAIIARELGIPAVVGCGDATARLRTGDRVLVNGDRGMVRLLDVEV